MKRELRGSEREGRERKGGEGEGKAESRLGYEGVAQAGHAEVSMATTGDKSTRNIPEYRQIKPHTHMCVRPYTRRRYRLVTPRPKSFPFDRFMPPLPATPNTIEELFLSFLLSFCPPLSSSPFRSLSYLPSSASLYKIDRPFLPILSSFQFPSFPFLLLSLSRSAPSLPT